MAAKNKEAVLTLLYLRFIGLGAFRSALLLHHERIVEILGVIHRGMHHAVRRIVGPFVVDGTVAADLALVWQRTAQQPRKEHKSAEGQTRKSHISAITFVSWVRQVYRHGQKHPFGKLVSTAWPTPYRHGTLRCFIVTRFR